MKISKILFLLSVPCSALAADTAWLDQASDCRSFERGVTQFYAELAAKPELDAQDNKDIDLVLGQACGERFGQCRFSICDEIKASSSSVPAKGSEPTELILGTESSQPAATPARLSWVKDSMNCDQFRAEFKKRYSAMSGRFTELSESEKQELSDALAMACSERFEKCNVSVCVTKTQPKYESSSAAAKPQGADSDLQRMYEKREKERKAAIAAKAEAEKRTGVKWKPFTISD